MKPKPTIWSRLKNAARAFLEGPRPPVVFEAKYAPMQPPLRTIASTAEYHYLYMDPDSFKAEAKDDAKRRIANRIGIELLNRGCIRFTEDACNMALIGEVHVHAPNPEKEAK